MKIFASIAKRDDSQRMVWGYASTEALDCQGETITHAAMSAALEGYMKFANIREMHQPSAVGIAKEAAMDEKGLFIGVKVVDSTAWEKVKEGVYKGFSIGGNVLERDPKNESTITALELVEISLVDRPANPEALIEVWKFHQGEKDMAKSTKAVAPESKKGFYEVARLADLCSALASLSCSIDYEAQYEEDGSALPGKIKGIAAQLCSALVELAAEESAEAVAQMGIATEEMKVAAEKLGKSADEEKEKDESEDEADKAKKSEEEEAAEAAAAAEEEEKAKKSAEEDADKEKDEADKSAEEKDDEEDNEEAKREKSANASLLKAAAAQNEVLEKFQKKMEEMNSSMEKMASRVKELEAMDAPRKGSLKEVPGAISKAQDVTGKPATPEPDDFLSAMKKVHAGGGQRYM